MKISKSAAATARRLFGLCQTGGRLDESKLRAAVSRLVADRGCALRMGARGRELAGEFDIARLVPAQEELYERLLAAARRGLREEEAAA